MCLQTLRGTNSASLRAGQAHHLRKRAIILGVPPMGGCLGSMLGSCIGSCAMTACCSAVSCRCLLSPVASNLLYVLFLVVAAIAGVSLRYSGEDLNMGARIGTQDSSLCEGDNCDGVAFKICNAESCTVCRTCLQALQCACTE